MSRRTVQVPSCAPDRPRRRSFHGILFSRSYLHDTQYVSARKLQLVPYGPADVIDGVDNMVVVDRQIFKISEDLFSKLAKGKLNASNHDRTCSASVIRSFATSHLYREMEVESADSMNQVHTWVIREATAQCQTRSK